MNKTCQFYLYFYFLLCFVFIYQTGFPFDKIHVKARQVGLIDNTSQKNTKRTQWHRRIQFRSLSTYKNEHFAKIVNGC